jgi:hypothetical protein
MRDHVLCNLSYAIKKCHLQLILVCKVVAKDTISQNIVPLLKSKCCLSKWVNNEENVICEKGDSKSYVE